MTDRGEGSKPMNHTRKKLLLAEDEQLLAEAIQEMLEFKGFSVSCAINGSDALSMARENRYDCMLLDIMMPVMSGTEALKIMREEGIHTPAILLTARGEVDDKVAGLDLGADDYITKPFSFDELIARINSVIRRRCGAVVLSAGCVRLDTLEGEMSAKHSIRLGPKETDLMRYLIQNINRDIDYAQVVEQVWEDDSDTDEEKLALYISYLNDKLDSINADIHILSGQHTCQLTETARSSTDGDRPQNS